MLVGYIYVLWSKPLISVTFALDQTVVIFWDITRFDKVLFINQSRKCFIIIVLRWDFENDKKEKKMSFIIPQILLWLRKLVTDYVWKESEKFTHVLGIIIYI